ncbi:MAG: hypothetical protein LBQ24_03045 [Candidatus Peribacteria bacterium]|jgi:hypothetical protein|nr:hypothetical protein [Candidatus Peribacteria bacterium]
MKKIFFTFLVLILGTNYSFAEECLIQDKSAPALLEYTKNNQAIIKNITNSISKTNVEQSSLDKIKSTSIIFFNSAFSLSSYHSSFTYYAIYPISNEVPPEIRRDYNLLQKEQN